MIKYNLHTQISIIAILITVLFCAIGCEQKKRVISDEDAEQYKEPLIKVNKYLVNKDEERIASFVKRRKWDMKMTETGLWYMIVKNGTGEKAETGKVISFEFELSLLNGTVCYTSDSLGVKRFKIGRGVVESGLEEGVLLLKEGDEARFIMPPHLAHGLIGDDDKIPPRSTIIYKLKVLDVSDY